MPPPVAPPPGGPLECQPRIGAHITVPIFHVIGAMRDFGGVLWPHAAATDGNAIFEHHGLFHVMHQTTHDTPAGASVPKHANWGHVVSRDLVHWTRVADALEPTSASSAYDWHDGDCDGTVTWDSGGLSDAPIMTFGPDCARGLTRNDAPRVGIARPLNATDPLLEAWVKDAANPIDFGSSTPCSFTGRLWQSADGGHINLICAINSMANRWGRYTTTNRTLHGPWTLRDASFAIRDDQPLGSISAPSFLPLANTTPGGPTHIINGAGGSGYWMGVYDERLERLNVSGELQKTEGGMANWFVAGVSQRDGRVLDIGFIEPYPYNASEPRGFRHTCYDHGFLCPLSSVRVLTYEERTQSLLSNPAAEYTELRNASLAQLPQLQIPSRRPLPLPLPHGTGATIDLTMSIPLPPGEATSISLEVLSSPSEVWADEPHSATRVTVSALTPDAAGARRGVLRLSSPRIDYSVNATFQLLRGEAAVGLRVLVDRSIVEVFAAGGRAVLSTRDYPGPLDLAVRLWSPRRATVSMSAWEMGCGWTDREGVLG